MPSSTSNSKLSDTHDDFVRPVPRGNWAISFAVAAIIAIVFFVSWELYVRSIGYYPTLNDTADLWADSRMTLAESEPDRTVIIGSSRILFDFDLETYAEYFKTEKPIQLALPGGAPLPVLEHIASDESFRGTLICGVVPGLYFVPEGFPIDKSLEAIERYENWSPSQRSGHLLGMAVENRLAFLQQEDLTLGALMGSLPVQNRPSVQVPPRMPPYFYVMNNDRRARLFENCGFDSPLAKKIQDIWVPLFTPPPPPPHLSPEEFGALYMKSVESYLERTKISVDKIVSRGGKVVFVRMPSSDKLREMENRDSPRTIFWERILAVTGAPGIHFEDYPELADFKCPEWSHLTSADSDLLTERLMPILAEKLK